MGVKEEQELEAEWDQVEASSRPVVAVQRQ